MKKSIKRLKYYCWLLFCLSASAYAAAQGTAARDSGTIIPRRFNAKVIDDFKSDSDFDYRTVAAPASSLWDRFWDYVWRTLLEMFDLAGGGSTLVWVLRIIAVLVLGMFVWQLTRMRRSGLFSASKSRGINYVVTEEDIHHIDFPKEISAAEEARNYRLAVRLLYLQTLKKLSDSGAIDWRIDKTNLSYLSELKEANIFQLFRRLTMQFEKNWYGNIPVSENEYVVVADDFKTLHNQIYA